MPSAHDNPTIDPGPGHGPGHGHGHDPSVGPDTPTLAGPPSSLILTDLIAAENGAIGPYRLLSVIGEGGFGVVYLAEQSQPIARRVALKVVKPGMDSRAVLQRFEQERQALAIIDHPNVARVLDAGVTQRARPYFVMEHVAGEPITAYCDRHKLSTRQRLELFIPVCEAVHHAHSKGIIHRDLKPSNILVALIGQRPVPKVIDFGVAKALHGRTAGAADAPAYTEVGQIVGTPEYMSPEQAEMNALDIDTRTDVYALGVVLYELLTGVLPLDSSHIRRLSLVEMQRIIREVDPPRPSTRLSTLADGDALAIAQRRRAEPRALARELSRELEWIPLKAMRKDRTERYRSAVELADDIRNYLERRPLLAGPESARYRLRKYLRRHALPVAAGGAIVLALAGGLIATSLALAEAHEANRRAEELRTQLLQVQNQLLASQSPEAVGVTAALPDADRLAPDPARAANAGPAPAEAAAPSKTTVEADPRPDADDRLADAEATQRRIVELS
ncbi:MAG: serine/threonine protein kinase, partial [Phycisphaeraceae bacterium]|nr:serine/threonine protein kinase [Phycisphaeraceae bacterium]